MELNNVRHFQLQYCVVTVVAENHKQEPTFWWIKCHWCEQSDYNWL